MLQLEDRPAEFNVKDRGPIAARVPIGKTVLPIDERIPDFCFDFGIGCERHVDVEHVQQTQQRVVRKRDQRFDFRETKLAVLVRVCQVHRTKE